MALSCSAPSSLHIRRSARSSLPLPALIAVPARALFLAGCDAVSDPVAKACARDTGASASACACVSDTMQKAMKPEEWRIVVLRARDDNDQAEIEITRLGISGGFGFTAHVAMALQLAGRQCKVVGL